MDIVVTYLSYSAMDSFSSVSVLARKSTWCSCLPIFRISLAATCDFDWRVANGMNGATEDRLGPPVALALPLVLPWLALLPLVALLLAELGAERGRFVGEGVALAVPAAKVTEAFVAPGFSCTRH